MGAACALAVTGAACALVVASAALLHSPRGASNMCRRPSEHPRTGYGDSLISLNDRCPFRLAKLIHYKRYT